MSLLQQLYQQSTNPITEMVAPNKYKDKAGYPTNESIGEQYSDTINQYLATPQNLPALFDSFGFTRCAVFKVSGAELTAVGVSDGYYMPQKYDYVTTDPDTKETQTKNINDKEQISQDWTTANRQLQPFYYAQRKFTFVKGSSEGTTLAAMGTIKLKEEDVKICLVGKKFDNYVVIAEMPICKMKTYHGENAPLYDKLNPVLSRFLKICDQMEDW